MLTNVKKMSLGMILILGSLVAAQPPRTIVVTSPGSPGSSADAQARMDGFAAALSSGAHTQIAAMYEPTDAGGARRLAESGIGIVSLPFFLAHEHELALRPRLQVVAKGRPALDPWALVAQKGKVTSANALAGITILSSVAFAPAFVRGDVLGSLGKLPDGVQLVQSTAVLSALRRAAAGEPVAVVLDGAQQASLESLPFAAKLEVVAKSPAMPAALVVTIDRKLPAKQWAALEPALARPRRGAIRRGSARRYRGDAVRADRRQGPGGGAQGVWRREPVRRASLRLLALPRRVRARRSTSRGRSASSRRATHRAAMPTSSSGEADLAWQHHAEPGQAAACSGAVPRRRGRRRTPDRRAARRDAGDELPDRARARCRARHARGAGGRARPVVPAPRAAERRVRLPARDRARPAGARALVDGPRRARPHGRAAAPRDRARTGARRGRTASRARARAAARAGVAGRPRRPGAGARRGARPRRRRSRPHPTTSSCSPRRSRRTVPPARPGPPTSARSTSPRPRAVPAIPRPCTGSPRRRRGSRRRRGDLRAAVAHRRRRRDRGAARRGAHTRTATATRRRRSSRCRCGRPRRTRARRGV